MKERLVGAAVLVLFAVLFVPELLSGPTRPTASPALPAVIDIPTSTAATVRRYTVDLEHPASQMPTADPQAPSGPQSPLPSTARHQAASVLAPTPEPAAPASSTKNAAPAPRPLVAAITPTGTETTATVAKPDAAPARRPSSFAPISERGGWSVQLGSFANKANAEKLAQSLRAKGIRVYLSQVSGKHRVRAGPFPDRAAAERAASHLRAQTLSVSIIAP